MNPASSCTSNPFPDKVAGEAGSPRGTPLSTPRLGGAWKVTRWGAGRNESGLKLHLNPFPDKVAGGSGSPRGTPLSTPRLGGAWKVTRWGAGRIESGLKLRLNPFQDLVRKMSNSIVTPESTVTNGANGGETPKSAIVAGTLPAISIRSPLSWAFAETVTSLVTPWIVSRP